MSLFDFSQRSHQKELIDLGPPHYTAKEYHACLRQLGRIGKYLGGDRATLKAFRNINPKSILDVGCGGGQFTKRLAQTYPKAKVVGIDISKEAIAFAQKSLENSHLHNVQFEVPPTVHLNYLRDSFDVVTATLVCHHLQDQEIVEFLKSAYQVASQAIIINDLHRHPLAYFGFCLVTPIFKNRLIFHDGLLSVKRSFTKAEWLNYFHAAGISQDRCSVTWHWAFRWMIKIDTRKG